MIIDLQRVFAEAGSPWRIPGFAALTEPIERLRAAFGAQVVFTRFVVPQHPEGSWREYYQTWDFALHPDAPLFDLAPPWSEWQGPVIDKTTFSAFGPELMKYAGHGNTLVLCGVSTECCVLSTAIAAVDAGTPVRIVSDACASVDAATHESALRVAEMGFAPMISLSTVEQELSRPGLS